jgi:inhibitor of KinA sporulation pathway (predicted exonuclease)
LHLLAQSQLDDARPLPLNYPHLNLKRLWRRTTGLKKKTGLSSALAFHDLTFEGNHHRGVDDARNIVRLLPFMDWSLESELLTPPEISE